MRNYFWFTYLTLLFLVSAITHAQNTPPTITATGDQQYCGNMPMNIVTNVSITDPDPTDTTLPVVYIQISEGYSNGQDVLTLAGTHPNITASWAPDLGRISLIGPATFAEYEAAIQDILFQTVQTNFTEDKFFSINLGDAKHRNPLDSRT